MRQNDNVSAVYYTQNHLQEGGCDRLTCHEVLSCNNRTFNSKVIDIWVIQIFSRNGMSYELKENMTDTANAKIVFDEHDHFEKLVCFI